MVLVRPLNLMTQETEAEQLDRNMKGLSTAGRDALLSALSDCIYRVSNLGKEKGYLTVWEVSLQDSTLGASEETSCEADHKPIQVPLRNRLLHFLGERHSLPERLLRNSQRTGQGHSIQGQLVGVTSRFPPCGSQGLKAAGLAAGGFICVRHFASLHISQVYLNVSFTTLN